MLLTALAASGWALSTFGLDAPFHHSAAKSKGTEKDGRLPSSPRADWRISRLNIRGEPGWEARGARPALAEGVGWLVAGGERDRDSREGGKEERDYELRC